LEKGNWSLLLPSSKNHIVGEEAIRKRDRFVQANRPLARRWKNMCPIETFQSNTVWKGIVAQR
jgi:hypothetical protein